MSRKPHPYNQIIAVLHELRMAYPSYNLGRHLATALDGYGDIWGMTDKEFLFALEKYKSQLDMDVQHIDEEEIDDILREGMNLDNILKEEEEDNGSN